MILWDIFFFGFLILSATVLDGARGQEGFGWYASTIVGLLGMGAAFFGLATHLPI